MLVNILSSSKQVLKMDDVKGLNVPTTSGQIGIYPGHAGLVSTLDIGELVVKTKDNGDKRIAVSGGFISVKNDKVEILCDDAVMGEEIVLAEIEKAEKKASEKMASKLPEKELIELEKQLKYEKFKRKLLEV